MQPEILRQREIVNEMMLLATELQELNKKIPDMHLKTDMFCLIGQHRHAFENQGVADHTQCVSFCMTTGTTKGGRGLLSMLLENPNVIALIREVLTNKIAGNASN